MTKRKAPTEIYGFHVELDSGLRGEIAKKLQILGFLPDQRPGVASAVEQFAELLARWARRMNLTGFRTPEDVARRLVLPVFEWSKVLPIRPTSIADIGSGAGIPGIPLALVFPSAEVLLVEARSRRHHFQRQAIRELGLENVTAISGRAESLPPRECELGVAQALAPLPEAAFHVKRWTRLGGTIAIPQNRPQGPVADRDLEWTGCPPYGPAPQSSFLWLSLRRA